MQNQSATVSEATARTAGRGGSDARNERLWRDGYVGGTAGGSAVAVAALFGWVCPPVGLAFGVCAVSSSVFANHSHTLVKEIDKTNDALKRLGESLDELCNTAMRLECLLQNARLIVDTVCRNTPHIQKAISADWSSSSNAVKQVHVRDAVAKCRTRVAQQAAKIDQSLDDLDYIRKQIFQQ